MIQLSVQVTLFGQHDFIIIYQNSATIFPFVWSRSTSLFVYQQGTTFGVNEGSRAWQPELYVNTLDFIKVEINSVIL